MKSIDLSVSSLPEEARLDKVIPHLSPDISRSQARKLIEGGSVYLNRKRCHQNAKMIKIGDKIRIHFPSEEEKEEISLRPEHILFENQDIIVVNKPPLLPTHETLDSSRHHLVLALQTFLGSRDHKKSTEIYLGVHHRLDRDTSGAILFTKRKEANAAVAQAFQARDVEKTYLAVCEGKPKQKSWLVKNFLGTSPRNKRIVASVKRDGKYAETEFLALEEKVVQEKALSLIEAKPKTGRTHQIRVHLAEDKLAILGDKTYGARLDFTGRVMLHAWKLRVLGLTFCAPMPEDFLSLGFMEPPQP